MMWILTVRILTLQQKLSNYVLCKRTIMRFEGIDTSSQTDLNSIYKEILAWQPKQTGFTILVQIQSTKTVLQKVYQCSGRYRWVSGVSTETPF